MPKIIINEIDNTSAGIGPYNSFAVVVPGFTKCGADKKIFDENGVYECSSQKDFEDNIGCVDGRITTVEDSGNMAKSGEPIHLGNQIAYELLGLGYKVLYKTLGDNVETAALKQLDETNFWAPLADKSTYDFRYIIVGMLNPTQKANNNISDLANFEPGNFIDKPDNYLTGRGDCTALLDIPENKYIGETSQAKIITAIKKAASELTSANKYSAIFVPTVCYPDSVGHLKDYNNTKFPASFHYLACAANAANNNFAEWYAVAGFSRGISPKFTIESTSVKLGEAAINALEPRNSNNELQKSVNVIAKIKNNYYLWGNRTARTLGVAGADDGDLIASHFLNIRQLCSTIKKQAYIACRRFTFDPNSETLWLNVTSVLTPMLEHMKADQGITDYQLVKVASNKKAEFKLKIRIIPIEAVEDFDIELSLEDSLGEPSVSARESI